MSERKIVSIRKGLRRYRGPERTIGDVQRDAAQRDDGEDYQPTAAEVRQMVERFGGGDDAA
jgi:hypothetical protein